MHALASVITEKFIQAAPKQAAEALSALATHEALLLVGGLKAQVLVSVLNQMDAPKAAAILRRLPLKQSSYVLAHLEIPQAAKIWKEFAAPYQARLKEVLAPAFVELVTRASGFAADSVGSRMQTDFVAVRTETKVADLVARLKNLPRTKIPPVCFVTGKKEELKGFIRTVELTFFDMQSICGSVMNKAVHSLRPQDDLATAQALFAKTQVEALPVVNEAQILMGVLEKTALFTLPTTKKTLWEKLTK